ncbi:polyribonucleotide nucleotidyltransferase [Candidatus Wolfebacteria bacterium]|nr:polyribonucleotide nucleotidyltransferase [Candidatus Wolfebacteria bacterium]
MDLNKKQFKTEVAGKELKLEVSNLAGQANAAVVGTYGDTSVLVTATMGKEDREIDYLPLVIDYEERFYAAGKIIGSRFVRREGRPSEEAILSGRMIDRSLRPLFNQKLRRDIQIIITVLSYDEENDPDFIALLTSSVALSISDIPWNGPLAGIKIAKLENETVINPENSTLKKETKPEFESFIAGTEEKINMIELNGNETKEENVIKSFELGQKEIKKLIEFQKKVIKEIGKPKLEYNFNENPELENQVRNFVKDKLEGAIYCSDKTERDKNLSLLLKELKNYLSEKGFESSLFGKVELLFEEEIDKLVHKNILESDKRPDGRRLDQVRELYGEVGLFKRLHGSAIFARGKTQALAAVTLAAPGAEQLVETMEITGKRRFMLHYNFPPYCVGEIGRLGSPGRREIGHGALAEKAIKPLIPDQEEFPYTIRVVSEILSSNGSSSMASACVASMALMDAGVPIKKPAAGIAMGLITDGKDKNKILTDIQGPEDHYGDIDCKVAGTTDGITAIQMDVKIDGIKLSTLKEIFIQAQKARLEILDFIKTVIAKPREKVSSYAPTIMSLNIKPDQIGEVVGPGGKIINGIIASTGALSIDIEQTGRIFVAANEEEKAQAAVNQIKAITKEFEIGEIIFGKIIKILDFGAIVDLGGGKDGMIHVSELKDGFVEKVENVVRLGDMVKAKIIKSENGKIGLSLKGVKTD